MLLSLTRNIKRNFAAYIHRLIILCAACTNLLSSRSGHVGSIAKSLDGLKGKLTAEAIHYTSTVGDMIETLRARYATECFDVKKMTSRQHLNSLHTHFAYSITCCRRIALATVTCLTGRHGCRANFVDCTATWQATESSHAQFGL